MRLRRRASSVMVSASPRPRTRSRVACTSSRTPARDSSAPSSSTVIRWVCRPTRCSSGTTASRSASSVRAATQSSSAAVKTGEVKWSASSSSTARVRRAPRGSRRSAAAASSAPRTSVTCSTAATTRSFLVGKWCSCAPRDTPARSLTSVVDVPAKPRSTSSSTVASISRARIARVRSSCGTRAVTAGTRPSWRRTNKQSSLLVSSDVRSRVSRAGPPTAAATARQPDDRGGDERQHHDETRGSSTTGCRRSGWAGRRRARRGAGHALVEVSG